MIELATAHIQDLGRRALPVLVDCAQKRDLITYSDLARRIGAPHWRPMRYVLAYIRDEVCAPRGIPLITAIVITKNTGLPGESFLPEGTVHLDPDQYRAAFERFRDDVFRYPHWDEVLRDLAMQPVEKTPDDLAEEARKHLEVQRRQAATGEADGHRRLKQFIATHPQLVGAPIDSEVTVEEELLSGDRCDVVFRWASEAAVAEVKCRERGELIQGIYQAVKYRAVLTAQEGQGDPFPVSVYLVAYAIADDIVDFARRFNIHCVTVDADEVQEEA